MLFSSLNNYFPDQTTSIEDTFVEDIEPTNVTIVVTRIIARVSVNLNLVWFRFGSDLAPRDALVSETPPFSKLCSWKR